MTSDRISPEKLAPHLESLLPGIERVSAIQKIATGQSNPTYIVETSNGKLVLRTKPPGPLLRSAHQVEREFRVMKALAWSGVPVPRMIHLSKDEDSPTGRAFFLMEYVEGRIYYDPALPGLSSAARARIFDSMNSVLARLHEVDVAEVGLSDFGRPGEYFSRQTRRWTEQYVASRFRQIPEMDRLAEWLLKNLPEDDGSRSLVHGDFRLDNIVFTPDSGRAVAVLDWELSTLGHPLADLAYQCMQWRLPHDGGMKGLGGLDREGLGMPNEQDYVSLYCERRGISAPENWPFYLVFSFFRLAAILEGVARRAIDGNASNPETAEKYGQSVPLLARMAVEILDNQKASVA